MIGIMHIAHSEHCRLSKAIFICISVDFKTIVTLALAIKPFALRLLSCVMKKILLYCRYIIRIELRSSMKAR